MLSHQGTARRIQPTRRLQLSLANTPNTYYVFHINRVGFEPLNKNLTLAIDEDLLDKARVLAAMKRTTVNAMVRDFLEREIKRETVKMTRAEAWGRVFEAADQNAHRRERRQSGRERLFEREHFYEEVMRERGLL